MTRNGSRIGWVIVIPAMALAVWLISATSVAWRGLGRRSGRIGNYLVRTLTDRNREPGNPPAGPVEISDPRLGFLRAAAATWQHKTGPRRRVIDQVCLVPDVPTFFEAIAAWDEQYYFPILIDDPAWTLPFVRAFHPARIVRYRRTLPVAATASKAEENDVWTDAARAAVRAWSRSTLPGDPVTLASLPPEGLGETPPGVVLSAPEAPMLAGAVALAAGHFQPLVQVQAPLARPSAPATSLRPLRFGDVLSVPQAWFFARTIEERVAWVVPRYDQLGDDCDFLTIAGDWPFRYASNEGNAPLQGLYALDDFIGRRHESNGGAGWINQMRHRWAYTGRLLGDSTESVARAMASLFLQPRSALLWNTYHGGTPWSEYAMTEAAQELAPLVNGLPAIVHRAAGAADLADWHGTVDPVNHFDMIMLNSSGAPDQFHIVGGEGRPSDIPRGVPATVMMIHSFSAADPTDFQTIAGRWLENGAFNYFGSVYEPFLHSFRSPRLVASLFAAGIPLVACLRQGELETFGFPWRLCYLGDPLYRLSGSQEKATTARRGSGSVARSESGDRIGPDAWLAALGNVPGWSVETIAPGPPSQEMTGQGVTPESDAKRLRWCFDASLREIVRHPAASALPAPTPTKETSQAHKSPAARPDRWRTLLPTIRRDQLEPRLRPFLDTFLIDTLEETGALVELATYLARVPLAERSARVWTALETCAMVRLASLASKTRSATTRVLMFDLWDDVMKTSWPGYSHFPAHFTERVATVAAHDDAGRQLWLTRLRQAERILAAEPARSSQVAIVSAERKRVEAQVGGTGARH